MQLIKQQRKKSCKGKFSNVRSSSQCGLSNVLQLQCIYKRPPARHDEK